MRTNWPTKKEEIACFAVQVSLFWWFEASPTDCTSVRISWRPRDEIYCNSQSKYINCFFIEKFYNFLLSSSWTTIRNWIRIESNADPQHCWYLNMPSEVKLRCNIPSLTPYWWNNPPFSTRYQEGGGEGGGTQEVVTAREWLRKQVQHEKRDGKTPPPPPTGTPNGSMLCYKTAATIHPHPSYTCIYFYLKIALVRKLQPVGGEVAVNAGLRLRLLQRPEQNKRDLFMMDCQYMTMTDRATRG